MERCTIVGKNADNQPSHWITVVCDMKFGIKGQDIVYMVRRVVDSWRYEFQVANSKGVSFQLFITMTSSNSACSIQERLVQSLGHQPVSPVGTRISLKTHFLCHLSSSLDLSPVRSSRSDIIPPRRKATRPRNPSSVISSKQASPLSTCHRM